MRDRYLDLLRALALVRVVIYHNFGWTWLPLLFPSMGVMFALAGSLMARSLSRPAFGVIRARLRRLLPPMWMFGAVVVTAMILDGWGPHSEGHPNWWWGKLAFWVLPLSTPPACLFRSVVTKKPWNFRCVKLASSDTRGSNCCCTVTVYW